MEGILTASRIIIKAARPVAARVDAPEFALAGQAVAIHVAPAEPTRHAFHLAVTSETGTLVEARQIRPSGGPITIDVAGTEPASPFAPVSSDILIWENPQPAPSAR